MIEFIHSSPDSADLRILPCAQGIAALIVRSLHTAGRVLGLVAVCCYNWSCCG